MQIGFGAVFYKKIPEQFGIKSEEDYAEKTEDSDLRVFEEDMDQEVYKRTPLEEDEIHPPIYNVNFFDGKAYLTCFTGKDASTISMPKEITSDLDKAQSSSQKKRIALIREKGEEL